MEKIGEYLIELGKNERAIEYLKRRYELQPSESQARLLTEQYVVIRRPKEAEHWMMKSFEKEGKICLEAGFYFDMVVSAYLEQGSYFDGLRLLFQ